jgi:NADH:ubiquinone oxidoreductase subunit K
MRLTLHFSRKKIMRVLISITVLLTLINLFHQFSWYFWQQDYKLLMWRFDFAGDKTVPTWFSSELLLLCAIFLFIIFQSKANQASKYKWHWLGLAVIFLALSIDETATLHEWSSSLLASYELDGIFYYAWVLFGLGFVGLFALVYGRFFFHLPKAQQRSFFLAAALYVGGALVVEMFNGRYESLFGAETLTYQLMTAVEELMEMGGVLLFIDALMKYIAKHIQTVILYPAAAPENNTPTMSVNKVKQPEMPNSNPV